MKEIVFYETGRVVHSIKPSRYGFAMLPRKDEDIKLPDGNMYFVNGILHDYDTRIIAVRLTKIEFKK